MSKLVENIILNDEEYSLSDFRLNRKNIFPIKKSNYTSNTGISFTYDNGRYLASGKATSYCYFRVYADTKQLPEGFVPGEDYFVKFNSTRKSITFTVDTYDQTGNPTKIYDAEFPGYFHLPENAVGIRFSIVVGTGTEISNFVVAPEVYAVNSLEYALVDDKQRRPMLTIIYDDGNKAFYESILPMVKEKKVAISSAVVSGWFGLATSMSVEEATECYRYGVEILDHTYSHKNPDDVKLLTAPEIQYQYTRGYQTLHSYGFNPPEALVFNGATAAQSACREAASNVYKCAFNAQTGGINFYKKFNPYNVNRYGADNKTAEQLKAWIDELYDAGTGWMVWTRHTSDVSAEAMQAISDAIDYARTKGIAIVSVRRAMSEYLDS